MFAIANCILKNIFLLTILQQMFAIFIATFVMSQNSKRQTRFLKSHSDWEFNASRNAYILIILFIFCIPLLKSQTFTHQTKCFPKKNSLRRNEFLSILLKGFVTIIVIFIATFWIYPFKRYLEYHFLLISLYRMKSSCYFIYAQVLDFVQPNISDLYSSMCLI